MFFDCDARSTANPKSGVLPIRSVSASPSPRAHADGPNGHRADNNIRDCGFGKVFTQIHTPVKGTVPDPQPSLHFLVYHTLYESNSLQFNTSPQPNVKPPIGWLPKLDFPKFDGDNPKLW
jgi:hypothetical protein